jgi:tetratricopeptide (TPR) repeat protein
VENEMMRASAPTHSRVSGISALADCFASILPNFGCRRRWDRCARSVLACGLLSAALMGCESTRQDSWAPQIEHTGSTSTIQDPRSVRYYPSDESTRMGREYFARGDFGTAERYFRDAVEKAPEDLTAWMGLAASYDRLGRFDLADRAYNAAIRLGGETTEILNNLAYSYMLRGDLKAARAKYNLALERDPGNQTIRNNIELLNASYKYIERNPQPGE